MTIDARALSLLAAQSPTRSEFARYLGLEQADADRLLGKLAATRLAWPTMRGSDVVWELTAAGQVAAKEMRA